MTAIRYALVALMAALTIETSWARDWQEIRIGVTGSYPPLSYTDQNNRFRGFEIDIARALCAQMEASCTFVQQEWSDMIPALLANRFDAIIASMSITEQRKEQVDFTDRYYQTPASFAARKATNLRDTSPQAMKGRLIGAQVNTIHANYLADVYAPAGALIKLYQTQQEAQFELGRGRLDALLADKIGVFQWLNSSQGACCALAGSDITDEDVMGDGVGIAVRKTDPDLKDQFNVAIAGILKNGTYKAINDKYFPFSVY